MVLLDWQKGKIPFFTLPPGHTEEKPPPMLIEEVIPLPEPAEAVTEADAAGEAGARPEDAAAGVCV